MLAISAGLLLVTGCGDDPLPDKSLNTLGTNSRAGPVVLRNVHIGRPADGHWESGERAKVFLTLVNNSDREAALVSVTSPQAKGITMRWDRDCDGKSQPVDTLPISAGGGVPPLTASQTAEHMPYYLTITAFRRPARAGTTVPLRFTFRHAGSVTVDAMVQPPNTGDEPAEYACKAQPAR